MPLDDVYLISAKRDVATEAQVRAAATAMNTRFPHGYLDYVTTLGAGVLNGQLRILLPTEIVERTEEYRAVEAELVADAEKNGFSVWDLVEVGLDLLPPDRWLAAVLLVDAGDGHRIVFHPDAPDDLIFIPHEGMEIYRAGSTLDESLTWFLETGPWAARTRVLTPDGQFIERPVRYFEPDRDREHISFDLKQTVTFTEMRTHLLDLARQQPNDMLFVSEAYSNDDGAEGEVLRLFVNEYDGVVWCNDVEPHITIQIHYDREHHTASLDQLIGFCRSRAIRLTDHNNRITLL